MSLLFLACGLGPAQKADPSPPKEEDIEQDVILRVGFEQTPPGPYTPEDLAAEWPSAEWSRGLDEERGTIVSETSGGRENQFLRARYPADTYGSRDQGVQWGVDLERHEALTLSYRLRFAPGFEFVRGGKLPGLMGGEGNRGGDRPDGTDGWSARMMWQARGRAIQYLYHPDQPGRYGEALQWAIDGAAVRFEPGTWHTVTHRIVMNTPGKHDGIIETWFDGERALLRDDLRLRDVPDFAIDHFYMSTFYGGADDSWAPSSETTIDFDDFMVQREAPRR